MKPTAIPAEKVSEQAGEPDPGYAAWELAKIERGLAQSRDRHVMISADRVCEDMSVQGIASRMRGLPL